MLLTISGHFEFRVLRLTLVELQSVCPRLLLQDLGHFEHKFNVRPRPFGTAPAVASVETIDDNNNSMFT